MPEADEFSAHAEDATVIPALCGGAELIFIVGALRQYSCFANIEEHSSGLILY